MAPADLARLGPVRRGSQPVRSRRVHGHRGGVGHRPRRFPDRADRTRQPSRDRRHHSARDAQIGARRGSKAAATVVDSRTGGGPPTSARDAERTGRRSRGGDVVQHRAADGARDRLGAISSSVSRTDRRDVDPAPTSRSASGRLLLLSRRARHVDGISLTAFDLVAAVPGGVIPKPQSPTLGHKGPARGQIEMEWGEARRRRSDGLGAAWIRHPARDVASRLGHDACPTDLEVSRGDRHVPAPRRGRRRCGMVPGSSPTRVDHGGANREARGEDDRYRPADVPCSPGALSRQRAAANSSQPRANRVRFRTVDRCASRPRRIPARPSPELGRMHSASRSCARRVGEHICSWTSLRVADEITLKTCPPAGTCANGPARRCCSEPSIASGCYCRIESWPVGAPGRVVGSCRSTGPPAQPAIEDGPSFSPRDTGGHCHEGAVARGDP